MDEEKENFLKRWSRLKRQLPASPAAVPATTNPAAPVKEPLPALHSLKFSSDFTVFMQDEVDTGLRRAALQQLFHDEHFNVMDGLDVYVDDYNSFEPISAELLANLQQARGLLFDEEPVAATADQVTPASDSQGESFSDSSVTPVTISKDTDEPE